MELKDFTKKVLENPKIDEPITEDGKKLTGQFFADGFMLELKDGLLNNDIETHAGRILPAVQGPGYIEYREKGALTDPKEEVPARSTEGFSMREFWQNGKFIKTE